MEDVFAGPSYREARQRIEAQPPQSEKIKRATVVIDNSGSREDTQQQVEVTYRAIEIKP